MTPGRPAAPGVRSVVPLGADRGERRAELHAVAGAEGEVLIDGKRFRLVPLEEAPAPAPHVGPGVTSLTARELQVASLVADGLVNKQIAARLQISEWTVSTHLRRVFAKLGVDTRAAMVSRCAAMISQRPT